jgi:hypothetical protein
MLAAMRWAFVTLLILLGAGCASRPADDGLLSSTALIESLDLEDDDVVPVARFSQLKAGAAQAPSWEPYLLQPASPRTRYHAAERSGVVCMRADATDGQSALQRLIRISPASHPVLEFSWLVPRLPGDTKPPARPSPRARLMLAFHGDPAKLDFEQRIHLRLAKAATGAALPYASLIYVWQEGMKAEAVVKSPYSERVRLIAMPAGADHLDRWQSFRRNVRDDYRRAFGEDPGDIVGVGIYTDVDNDGGPGQAFYGDITFRRTAQTIAR